MNYCLLQRSQWTDANMTVTGLSCLDGKGWTREQGKAVTTLSTSYMVTNNRFTSSEYDEVVPRRMYDYFRLDLMGLSGVSLQRGNMCSNTPMEFCFIIHGNEM